MGLFEILLIAVVALLVVGPERMPEAVRGAAMTIGRFKRMFNNTKEEFEKHIGADDIRLQLHNEQIMENLKKMEQDISDIGDDAAKIANSDIERQFMAQDDYKDPPEIEEDAHQENIEGESFSKEETDEENSILNKNESSV